MQILFKKVRNAMFVSRNVGNANFVSKNVGNANFDQKTSEMQILFKKR